MNPHEFEPPRDDRGKIELDAFLQAATQADPRPEIRASVCVAQRSVTTLGVEILVGWGEAGPPYFFPKYTTKWQHNPWKATSERDVTDQLQETLRLAFDDLIAQIVAATPHAPDLLSNLMSARFRAEMERG